MHPLSPGGTEVLSATDGSQDVPSAMLAGMPRSPSSRLSSCGARQPFLKSCEWLVTKAARPDAKLSLLQELLTPLGFSSEHLGALFETVDWVREGVRWNEKGEIVHAETNTVLHPTEEMAPV